MTRPNRPLPRQVRGPGRPPMRAPRGRSARTAIAVVGSLTILVGLAMVTETGSARSSLGSGTRVTVQSSVAVCPHPDSDGTAAKLTRLTIAAPPAEIVSGELADASPDGEPAKGSATVTKAGKQKSVLSLAEPGTLAQLNVPAWKDPNDVPPLIARASGPVAPGFSASQVTRNTAGQRRSLSGTPCLEPGTEFWFAGTGSTEARFTSLYLINPESSSAQVDIELFGPSGRIELPGQDKVVLTPGQRVVRVMQAMIPGQEQLVVRVIARVGRVAAAMYDQQHDGRSPRGADWIPGAREAASQLVVPGVPGGSGERTLYLFAPGDEGALVHLQLAGKNGTFIPASTDPSNPESVALDAVSIEGSKVKEFDLAKVANGEPFAVLVDSDKPLIALVRVGTGDDPPDVAYLTATAPLGGPSMVTDVRLSGSGKTAVVSTLVFSVPGTRDAKVSIFALFKGEEPRLIAEELAIAAGTTKEDPLKGLKGDFAIMITPLPGSGPVYASRVLAERSPDGNLLTIEQFQPSHTTALVPDVVNDLSAGLRPGE